MFRGDLDEAFTEMRRVWRISKLSRDFTPLCQFLLSFFAKIANRRALRVPGSTPKLRHAQLCDTNLFYISPHHSGFYAHVAFMFRGDLDEAFTEMRGVVI